MKLSKILNFKIFTFGADYNSECQTVRHGCIIDKIKYGHLKTAQKAAAQMQESTGKEFSAYKCSNCGKYHIGKNRGGIMGFSITLEKHQDR